MDITFVLVRPAYPSNVGATARALKAMGFSKLAVIDPLADLNNERVRKLGKHADDVIDKIEVYEDLKPIFENHDLVVASSHRIRRARQASLTSRQLNEYLSDREHLATSLAVLFGPESTGLKNEEVAACDAVVQVPCAQEQPSLNLAQAVMVISYELSQLDLRLSSKQSKRLSRKPSSLTYKALKDQVRELISHSHKSPNPDLADKVVNRLDALSLEDLHLMHDFKHWVETQVSSNTDSQ